MLPIVKLNVSATYFVTFYDEICSTCSTFIVHRHKSLVMKQPSSLEQLLTQLGNELYYHRHTTKQKMVSVSKAVGVSHAVISRIENGRYAPLTLSLLKRLADYYEIPGSIICQQQWER